MNSDHIKRLRDLLVQRSTELQNLEKMGEDATKPVKLDQGRVGRLSRVGAMQSQAMSVAAQQRRQGELKRIAAALARMDEDDYGYCENCGEEIAIARLEVDPSAMLCIKCATEAEDNA